MALVLGLGVGMAVAYFTSSGSGSGSATVSSGASVQIVTATGSVTGTLYPGGSGDLRIGIQNPNTFPVTLVAVAAGGPAVTGSGGIGTCTTPGVSVNPQLGLSINLPASTTTQVLITGGVSMSVTSDSGCQNATFSVPVALTVHQP